MFEYPALKATLFYLCIYSAIGTFPLGIVLLTKSTNRATFLAMGFILMYFAAFILSATQGVLGLVSGYLLKPSDYSVVQLSAMREFGTYTQFIGYLASFLFGGVGVNAFSKAIPNISGQEADIRGIMEEIQAKKEKIS